MEAHLAHNQENAGSSPVSATQRLKGKRKNKRKEYVYGIFTGYGK